MNERSCFCRLVLRGASGVCFDDAGRQPDGAVFEVGSWQVFATGVYVCMCGEPDGTVD